MNEESKIAIIGGGSWATALAKIVLNTCESINWYMRRNEQIDEFIRLGKNPSYLSGVKFDTDRIFFTTDINKLVRTSDVLIFAVPSPFFKNAFEKAEAQFRQKNHCFGNKRNCS